jgi:hypothetical protein
MPKERQYQAEGTFFKQTVVCDYLDKRWDAERNNRDNFLRLYELLVSEKDWPHGGGSNAEVKEAIRKKLTIFKMKIQQNTTKYNALVLNFKKYPFESVLPDGLKDDPAVKMFGGEVQSW